MNKKLLVAAIAGLLLAGNANAQVVLGTSAARSYAIEINNGVALTDADDDIQVALGYNFSAGEVRYGRLECTSNMTIASPVISETSADISLGAINGANTNALFFSITAGGAPAATSAVVLSLESTNTLLDKNAVTCAFSIYDQPSQAQAGGPTGRIYTTGFQPFINRAKSFVFSTAGGKSTADVSATPAAYTKFTGTPEDMDYGSLTFGLATVVPRDIDGSSITLADIFDATTNVVVTGNFAAAGTSAWNAVNGDMNVPKTNTTWTGAGLIAGRTGVLTYNRDGVTEIPVGTFSAALNVVTNTGYSASNESLSLVGEIDRNGTQLQAPLVHVPASGYVSRLALTNTGVVSRPFSIRIINETGTQYTTNNANMSGTIPAGGTRVVELNSVITGFTAGAPRATIIVTADAPNTDIQGLYQIVNPASGGISNHVMVRPGSN